VTIIQQYDIVLLRLRVL